MQRFISWLFAMLLAKTTYLCIVNVAFRVVMASAAVHETGVGRIHDESWFTFYLITLPKDLVSLGFDCLVSPLNF